MSARRKEHFAKNRVFLIERAEEVSLVWSPVKAVDVFGFESVVVRKVG